MKNRFLSIIIALSLILTSMATVASAKSEFPDVLSPDHDWCSKQIETMTDMGLIKGYTDGSFKPDKAISKIEALILFARVAGYTEDAYSKVVDFANNKYRYILEELELDAYDAYKGEISFLLYKGVIAEDEVVEYLEDEQYLDEFPRKDAAILISKMMDAEIKSTTSKELEFADKDDIKNSDAGYIAYVVENGFMNGVELEDGSVVFDADKALSRAQVCVLLYRIVRNLDMSVESGVVFDIGSEGGVVAFENEEGEDKSYVIPKEAKVFVDGEAGAVSDILENSDIVVVRHGKTIYSVDIINPESNKTVKGVVKGVVSKDNYARITVRPDDAETGVTYYGDDEFQVTTDGVKDSMKSIKVDDYVVIKLLGTEIVSIDRLTAEATVQGTLKSINLENPITLSVTTIEEISEEEANHDYEVLVGDKVVLTVKRGVVTKIVATSSKGSATGTVTAVKIAAQSSITISESGKETEYAIGMDSEYIVAGSKASIYDLRLGNLVTLTLSGSTATKIEQTAASSTTTKSGTVESISTAYGYINMISNNAVSEQIFASKSGSNIGAKIINGETGKEISFKNIKKGDYIIATGAYNNGAFVAKTIVVTPMAE